MSSNRTHYEVLEVSRDASPEEIDDAFDDQMLEHPPEQDPEGFQRAQEAHDVLSNSVARAEYDNMLAYGSEIDTLREEAEGILRAEEGDTEKAIRKLRKAIVLGPEIALLRDMLGQCYLQTEQSEKAEKQFQRAIEIDESNTAYHVHYGQALRETGDLGKARQVLQDVWEEDPGNHRVGRALAGVIFAQGKPESSIEILDNTINADGKKDFEDFFCYHDKLQILAGQGDPDALKRNMETVIGLADSEQDKKFASFTLLQTSRALHEVNMFGPAYRFAEGAHKLNPDNAVARLLEEQLRPVGELDEEVTELIARDDIHDYVKGIVVTFHQWNVGAVSEEEFRKHVSQTAGVMNDVLKVDPQGKEVRESQKVVEEEYPRTAEICSEMFQAIKQAPEATHFSAPCPHCGDTVTARKNDTTKGACPSCGGHLLPVSSSSFADPGDVVRRFEAQLRDSSSRKSKNRQRKASSSTQSSSSSHTKESSTSDSSSSWGWGTWIGIFMFLLFMMSMCG